MSVCIRRESVQEMFSRTAAEFDAEPAIERAGKTITYGELERESNRLANFLDDAGITEGTTVGLFTDDPIQIITGILGVLKTGSVFVPLDPTFPQHRLRVMSEQVCPGWYLAGRKYLDNLGRVHGEGAFRARAVCLDAADGEVSTAQAEELSRRGLEVERSYQSYRRAERPARGGDPEGPCSIYFTSGSTGKPKAILGRLKGIDHFIRWEIETVGVKAGTRVSQLASPSFDGFLKDAFVPLCAGGVVCAPASRDLIFDARALAGWLDDNRVEVLHCVPSMFRSLINMGLDAAYFQTMKCTVLTGEPLYPSDVKIWMDVFGERIRLLNIYGTTETSLSKFWHEVTPEDVDRPSIPVGKPMEGTSALVINSRGRLCREEAVGEIYIRTPYRSLGYYGEPELTKEVFVQNPFSSDPADILHRTGDYGRLLEDGNLEILGRRDQQVKIRGVRIELGEIENLLRGHEGVRDVAVIDREDSQGNKVLVAYLTLNNGTNCEPLRGYLSELLPEMMVPSAFVALKELPRTLNGKIDRKSLPAFEPERVGIESEAGPRTPIEEIVAAIWCDVLKAPRVLRTDSFFQLGGHSLLVTQILSRVSESLKVEVPIRSLFEARTLEKFSHLIEDQIGQSGRRDMGRIETVPRIGELPLSFAQQRMWFLENLAEGTSAFHIPLGVRLKGRTSKAAFEQTFGEIMRRHETLRTVFESVNNRPVQFIKASFTFRLPIVDLSGFTGQERESVAVRLAQEEVSRRFDLASGPLVRLMLTVMGEEDNIVGCTLHHIIADGQSFEVIVEEMNRLLSGFIQGQPSPLPELSVQYVDYVAWERRWLQGELLQGRLDYWRRQLAGVPARLSLPNQRSRPPVQGFAGARLPVILESGLATGLRELSKRESVTLFMTMLSAFVLLLNRYSGDEDIVVGSVYANRERAESEHLIGILTNTLVLRVDLSEAMTFKDVVRRVRDVCLDAYTFHVPPEILREDLNKRGRKSERLFDVWFQLERQERRRLEVPGLECEWFQAREEPKFEMSMMFVEGNDEIRGVLEYDPQLFDDETMAEMAESYVGLLQRMLADVDEQP